MNLWSLGIGMFVALDSVGNPSWALDGRAIFLSLGVTTRVVERGKCRPNPGEKCLSFTLSDDLVIQKTPLAEHHQRPTQSSLLCHCCQRAVLEEA